MCECCALHNLLGLETVKSCQQKSWWAVMFSTRVFTVKPKQENNWKRLTSSVSNHLHSRRHQACDWVNLFLLKLYSSGGSTLSTRVLFQQRSGLMAHPTTWRAIWCHPCQPIRQTVLPFRGMPQGQDTFSLHSSAASLYPSSASTRVNKLYTLYYKA